MTSKIRAVLSVFAPIIVLGSWMAYHAFLGAGDNVVRLPIEGIDPRDLLAGHYLTYRVDYGMAVDCNAREEDWCLCVDGLNGDDAAATAQGSCSYMSDCGKLLRGSCASGRFDAGLDRYYFPEEYKTELARVPPKASIVVALTSSGHPTVKQLLVDGVPVLDWLASRQ